MQKQNRAKSFSYIKGSLNRKNRLIKKQLYVVFQWTKPHAGVLHAVVPWNYSFSRLCGCTTECFCPSEPLPIAVFFILHIVAFCILIMDLPPLTKSFSYIKGSLNRKNRLIKKQLYVMFQWTKPHAGVLHAVVPWNYSFRIRRRRHGGVDGSAGQDFAEQKTERKRALERRFADEFRLKKRSKKIY